MPELRMRLVLAPPFIIRHKRPACHSGEQRTSEHTQEAAKEIADDHRQREDHRDADAHDHIASVLPLHHWNYAAPYQTAMVGTQRRVLRLRCNVSSRRTGTMSPGGSSPTLYAGIFLAVAAIVLADLIGGWL